MPESVLSTLIGVGAVVILVWLMLPSRSTAQPGEQGEFIDPSDPRQIGLLMGIVGRDVADAAVVRYALERFEKLHGRKATTRDIGVVVGLITGGKPGP